jgi:ribokinase
VTEAVARPLLPDDRHGHGLAKAVVVTLGAAGALVVSPTGVAHVEPPVLAAVDTTGAGDTFNGALAATLAEGIGIFDGTRRAVVAASLAVTAAGARVGMP